MSISAQPEITIERGTVFESRDEYYQLLYADEYVVVLRTTTDRDDLSDRHNDDSRTNRRRDDQTYSHRLERRQMFEKLVDGGRFTPVHNTEIDYMEKSQLQWRDVDCIGKQTEQNLYDAGYETAYDVIQASDDDLLSVTGVGQQGLQNLRQFI